MLDFGWSEFFLVIVLAIVLMGPKDIPEIIYQFGRLVRRAQYMKFALSKQFDTFMEQNDLQELRKGGMLGEMKGDLRAALTPTLPAQSAPTSPDPLAEAEDDEGYYAEIAPEPVSLELPFEGGVEPERPKVGAQK